MFKEKSYAVDHPTLYTSHRRSEMRERRVQSPSVVTLQVLQRPEAKYRWHVYKAISERVHAEVMPGSQSGSNALATYRDMCCVLPTRWNHSAKL